ncbi:MAG: hypothetical protein PHS46_07225 [Candidatus Omnitrophica bacterium]|nr:hypothetical protein [Candidatus Omnitrophota bacterium]
MSKIMNTLNNPFKKERVRSSAQEEIAKIYLKVSDKTKHRKEKRVPVFPWAIAAVTLFLAVVMFLFKSNIDVKIKILGEIPSFNTGTPDKFGSLREKGLYLIKGSEVNKYLVEDAGFRGDARTFSKIDKDEIILCNARGNGWANYEITLKEPVDLTKLDIRYTARGETGEEYVAISIVDSDNRSYRIPKNITSKLSKEWQAHTINLKPLKNAVDLKNIVTIRFEFGSLTAGNSSMATIFIKDICVTKTKRREV